MVVMQYIFVTWVKNEYAEVILELRIHTYHIYSRKHVVCMWHGPLSRNSAVVRETVGVMKAQSSEQPLQSMPLLHCQGKAFLQNSLDSVGHSKLPTCLGKWVFEKLFCFLVVFLSSHTLVMEISIPTVQCVLQDYYYYCFHDLNFYIK